MYEAMENRTIECPICGKKATESFFGIGFPGWLQILSIFDPETKKNPILCPECKKLFIMCLNKQAKILPIEIKKEEK